MSFDTKPFNVTPEIITVPGFSLTVYKSDEDYPPKFWNKYNAKKLSLRLSGGKICKDFGVNAWNIEEGRLDYFIGIRTEDVNGNTSGTQKIAIEGGLYAMFQTPKTTHANFVNNIHNTWDYINRVWQLESNYRRTGKHDFESYIEESRVFSEKIYISIEKK